MLRDDVQEGSFANISPALNVILGPGRRILRSTTTLPGMLKEYPPTEHVGSHNAASLRVNRGSISRV
jgi:hypothetical protein